ncbi:alcohol dehydrogenase [Pyrococcus furiosus DSM 3638]|uniref:Alcohol dehydrogenase n=4 Tax=Pyrococcus furiosus TaxID=2261 RepID=E7FHL9_PYRFU|nr:MULTISPECIES: iron-containing alcohol dehydrogenase [Pyrococcus]AAC25557.1 iron containing alcohol dehydrogenase [Pyrococcus furiosus DSM 3638]AAL80199.1 alcohol dehydrogenase [Pyrococcus furiosus DSM 3638]AFN04499.1 iron-containing alcohol dehydrogenase [Pyrococcus furiosus COM1]MDK2870315.1 alcohol dehydrogenase [Pyrococcus sp.]QEK77809.1 alcohol dehydrogenase [Pyrococcus furiosus DSM 3638]
MFEISIYLPTEIVFGPGKLEMLPKLVKKHGLSGKALIVTGRRSTKETGVLYRVQELLKQAGVESIVFDKIIPNPISTHVDEGAEIARKENVSFVVGLGGGSAIDSAKAIAMTAASGGKYWDYVPAVGGGKKPTGALPIVAIPTTHGTGTEADPYAVITNPETKEKQGIGYDVLFPKFSIVDPELMLTLPKDQTVYTSMDAFYHSIEAFLNVRANPYSDVLALDSMRRIVTYLPLAYENLRNLEARTQLAWASTEAGITETVTGVVANHALEHGLSGFYPEVPHGLGLCILGPYLFEYILDYAYEKLAIVGREVFGVYEPNDRKAAELAIKKLRDFQSLFGVNKKLRELGVKEEDIPEMARTAYRMMKPVIEATPGDLKVEDLEEIYRRAY